MMACSLPVLAAMPGDERPLRFLQALKQGVFCHLPGTADSRLEAMSRRALTAPGREPLNMSEVLNCHHTEKSAICPQQ